MLHISDEHEGGRDIPLSISSLAFGKYVMGRITERGYFYNGEYHPTLTIWTSPTISDVYSFPKEWENLPDWHSPYWVMLIDHDGQVYRVDGVEAVIIGEMPKFWKKWTPEH